MKREILYLLWKYVNRFIDCMHFDGWVLSDFVYKSPQIYRYCWMQGFSPLPINKTVLVKNVLHIFYTL